MSNSNSFSNSTEQAFFEGRPIKADPKDVKSLGSLPQRHQIKIFLKTNNFSCIELARIRIQKKFNK